MESHRKLRSFTVTKDDETPHTGWKAGVRESDSTSVDVENERVHDDSPDAG